MNRRTFLQVLPAIWLTVQPISGGTAELAIAHLQIEGMT